MSNTSTKEQLSADRDVLTEWGDEIYESGAEDDQQALRELADEAARQRQNNEEMRKHGAEILKAAHQDIGEVEHSRLEDNQRQ